MRETRQRGRGEWSEAGLTPLSLRSRLPLGVIVAAGPDSGVFVGGCAAPRRGSALAGPLAVGFA